MCFLSSIVSYTRSLPFKLIDQISLDLHLDRTKGLRFQKFTTSYSFYPPDLH